LVDITTSRPTDRVVAASHRISGKTPIEDVIETMKEFVLYVAPFADDTHGVVPD
jgi:hypothetical protein